jgi:uncharacterized OB-fold protein
MAGPAKDRKLPAPAVSPETEAYWKAAAEGRLLVRKCQACGETHHFPRTICPFCFSDRTDWIAASGEGTIYSFSVMRRAPVPYVMAYVTLAEGPSMMTNIVDCDFDKLRIGQAVKVVFKSSEGGPPLPMFSPA